MVKSQPKGRKSEISIWNFLEYVDHNENFWGTVQMGKTNSLILRLGKEDIIWILLQNLVQINKFLD